MQSLSEKKQRKSVGKPHPKSMFTVKEDIELDSYVKTYGNHDWEHIAKMMPNRNARQCMERWNKYLAPNINREPFTKEEDELLLAKHREIGGKWTSIAKYFNNRTDIAIKNRWNVLMRQNKNMENIQMEKKEEDIKIEERKEDTKCAYKDNDKTEYLQQLLYINDLDTLDFDNEFSLFSK